MRAGTARPRERLPIGSTIARRAWTPSARDAFNRTGLGYRGFNNGLLVHMIPAFSSKDFAGGVRAGVNALMALASKKKIPNEFRPAACAQ